jgi:hypothetical protein
MSTELEKAKIFNNCHFAAFINEERLYYVTVTAHQLINQADIQHYCNAAVMTLQNVMKFCISFIIQHTHC